MIDFRLGERSDAFREEVRAFLGEHFRPDMVERAHDTGTAHVPLAITSWCWDARCGAPP